MTELSVEDMLHAVMDQAESDLKAAHAEICKLQGLDPAKHSWPAWSSPANTLRWFNDIRNESIHPPGMRIGEIDPTITFTARRWSLLERLYGAWFFLCQHWRKP